MYNEAAEYFDTQAQYTEYAYQVEIPDNPDDEDKGKLETDGD